MLHARGLNEGQIELCYTDGGPNDSRFDARFKNGAPNDSRIERCSAARGSNGSRFDPEKWPVVETSLILTGVPCANAKRATKEPLFLNH